MVKQSISPIPLVVSLDVPQVTHVSRQVLGSRMGMPMWIVVGARSRATLEEVPILVDVETVLLTCTQTGEGTLDLTQG